MNINHFENGMDASADYANEYRLLFVIMLHSDDYIALFLPFFNVPVRLGHLFQRIESINDRFYLSRLYQLFE
jgi:hypothetical protein